MIDEHPVLHMSRAQFIRDYGHVPQEGTIGLVWVACDGKTIVLEIIFTDNKDVEELERMYRL